MGFKERALVLIKNINNANLIGQTEKEMGAGHWN